MPMLLPPPTTTFPSLPPSAPLATPLPHPLLLVVLAAMSSSPPPPPPDDGEGSDGNTGRSLSYGEAEYWDARYVEEGGAPYDWYQRYDALRPFVRRFAPPASRLLMIGCGSAPRPGFTGKIRRQVLDPVPLTERGRLPDEFAPEDPDSHYVYVCEKMQGLTGAGSPTVNHIDRQGEE